MDEKRLARLEARVEALTEPATTLAGLAPDRETLRAALVGLVEAGAIEIELDPGESIEDAIDVFLKERETE